MTTFLFVRHGRIAKGTADPTLSSVGKEEAAKTAVHLQTQPITHIFASPLRRARETADIIAAAHRLPVIIEPLLRERANWGDASEQSFPDFVAMWELSNRKRDWQPPVGDSARSAGQRIEQFSKVQQQQHPQATILAVTHGGVIADFLLNVFTVAELTAVHPQFSAAPYSGEIMRQCSVTVAQFDGKRVDLKAVAQIEHLD